LIRYPLSTATLSRPFINPSWAGINESLRSLCSENNLEKLTDIWYIKSELYGSYYQSIEKRLTSSILEMDTKFENKLSTLLQLISANTRYNRPRDVDAIACSHCQMICSVPEIKKSTWPLHPSDPNDLISISSTSLKRSVDLRGEEFYLYIEKITTFLSASQAESLATIMNTTQNCFLTGGAGSGGRGSPSDKLSSNITIAKHAKHMLCMQDGSSNHQNTYLLYTRWK
jgi:hypothetical protein